MSRVRMPHNNRVSSSSALRTNDMWSKTIGYDPYAADGEASKVDHGANEEQVQSLMLLAKMSNLSGVESRGGCAKCGMLGHLTFQCRNPQTKPRAEVASDSESSDSDDSDESNRIDKHRINKNNEAEIPHSRKRSRSVDSSSSKSESNKHMRKDDVTSSKSRNKHRKHCTDGEKHNKKDNKKAHKKGKKKDKKTKHKKVKKSHR